MTESSILVVDDHPLVTEAIGAAVSTFGEFKVLSASSAAEMRQVLGSLGGSDHDIRAVFMDIQLPDADGSDLIHYLMNDYQIPAVAMSAYGDELTIINCMKKGAAGFVKKSSQLTVFATALSVVISGGQYFPAGIVGGHTLGKTRMAAGLSTKQQKILDLICQGKTNKQIGEEMCLAEGTIKNKVSEFLEIFGVDSRLQLIFALKQL